MLLEIQVIQLEKRRKEKVVENARKKKRRRKHDEIKPVFTLSHATSFGFARPAFRFPLETNLCSFLPRSSILAYNQPTFFLSFFFSSYVHILTIGNVENRLNLSLTRISFPCEENDWLQFPTFI